ncbi:hypothetical protein MCOR31_011249, partial [Pyricularia oryzae]
MANHPNPNSATSNQYYQSAPRDYSTTTSSYYGPASPDGAANAPEVVPTDVPPHSRGDNQPQMMAMDWQERGKPAIQTYYDPKIGTYPESVPTPPYP